MALRRLGRRVMLDGPYAFERYAPFVGWRRALAGEPQPAPWQDTIRLYRAWTNRYPQRAENAALQAGGASAQALNIVQAAIERGAQPAGLLESLSTQLQGAAELSHEFH